MKLTVGALTSLHDSAIRRGGDPDTVRLVLTLLLKSAVKNYQGTRDWAEDETKLAEEELAAIEEASGLIEPDEDEPEKAIKKSILEYVERKR